MCPVSLTSVTTVGSLVTAAELALPVVIIVVNNMVMANERDRDALEQLCRERVPHW